MAKERANTKVKGRMPKKMKISQNFSKCSIVSQNVPFSSQNVPFFSQNVPFFSQTVPFSSQNVPFFSQNVPCSSQKVPFLSQKIIFPSQKDKKNKKYSKYPGLIQKGGDCCERQKIEIFFFAKS
jgi:hypothetical protein